MILLCMTLLVSSDALTDTVPNGIVCTLAYAVRYDRAKTFMASCLTSTILLTFIYQDL